MLPFISLVGLTIGSTEAWANRPALDPLNRLHLGASFSDQRTVGVHGGLDSRLTRLVFVDLGGFVSPMDFPFEDIGFSEDVADYVFLRHGIYVAPGLRIPHRQKEGFSWDVIGRGGMSAVWSADVDPDNFLGPGGPDYEVEPDPALLFGADAQVRFDRLGFRVGGKGYTFSVYSQSKAVDVAVVKVQWFGEVMYQW